MADQKISQLTSASALGGADVAPLVQSGSNVKATVQQIITAATGATGTNGETVTTSKPRLDLTQTWNASGTTFTGVKLNVTNTASAAGSLLADLQVGGTSKFNVDKDGKVVLGSAGNISIGGSISAVAPTYVRAPWFACQSNSGRISLGSDDDVNFYRDAANTLAQRNGANAQTYNVYQSYTNDSNYTRGALSAASATVKLAAESAGTGEANIDVELAPKGTGAVKFGTHAAIGDLTVTGYIEIKDSSGTIRKLAVVS